MKTQHLPLLAGSRRLDLAWDERHAFSFTARLSPGLYTFGIQTDMRSFDWKSLYYPLTKYGNKGQRTGPWDFDLYHENVPLIPTWRVFFDDRYVGLFYIQRPTTQDLERRTLRGEFGFHVDREREIAVRAEPRHPFTLSPVAAYLEPNAFDRLEKPAWTARGLDANWAHAAGQPAAWAARRAAFADSEWKPLLREGLDRYTHGWTPPATDGRAPVTLPSDALPVLIAARRLMDAPDAIEQARAIVRHYLDLPAWGNPNPDGYGHNGDMGCALIIKYLALAFAWMTDAELGDLKPRLLARLEKQMDLFFEQQLLMAQYWGGAILQDHGFRSSASTAFAALALLGHSPRAPFWLSFYLPRIRRTLRALPEDGFIPFSSYHKLSLYGLDMADLHAALRFASGDNMMALPCYRRVPDFLLATLDEASMSYQVSNTRGDRKDFNVGLNFLIALAQDAKIRKAAWLARLLMDSYVRDPGALPVYFKIFETLPLSICLHPGSLPRVPRPRVPALNHFPDGGFLAWRNDRARFHVSINAYPVDGAFHAAGTDLSGTDKGLHNPSTGHFSVALGREPLIQNAESGYRTGSHLSNAPLFDGMGQLGDNGYTMGIPMEKHTGTRIQACRSSCRGGFARVNLAPAYPECLNVMTATRDFVFAPAGLTVTDTLITLVPRRVTWRFHTYVRHTLTQLDSNRFRFAYQDSALDLVIRGEGLEFSFGDTEVVWAYGNEQEDQPFRHLEVRGPLTRQCQVEFRIDWISSPAATREGL